MDRRTFLIGSGLPLFAAWTARGWGLVASPGEIPPARRGRGRRGAGPCFDVRTFGAKGDGTTFDDAALMAAVGAATAAGGGTVYLPPATYRVADHKEVALRDVANVVLYGPGALLRNDSDTGNDGGVITFRGSCHDVSIVGLGFEAATASPNSYDNMLSFYCRPPDGLRNVSIRGCRFLRASNKHLNFDGPASGITIEGCSFEDSAFNSNPLDVHSRFASVYFEFNQRAAFEVADVAIRGNYFSGNSLFCVSMDEFAFPGGQALFHGIHVTENVFRDSTGGVWVRGGDVHVERNAFFSVGMGQVSRRYAYQRPLNRFLSLTRSAAGQAPERANTVPLQTSAVVVVDSSRDAWVEGNTFVDCAPAQFGGPYRPPGGIYVSTDSASGLRITGNRAYERSAPPATVPPFQCSTTAGSTCDGNEVLVGQVPPAVPPTPAWPDSLTTAGYRCA